jgi:uncharacterized protein (DUF58 family)
MILTAATYGNNLVYILAFTLFAVFLISMVQTNVNLKNIEIVGAQIDDVSAGVPVVVRLQLANTGKLSRIFLLLGDNKVEQLAPNDVIVVTVQKPAQLRGVHFLERVEISTLYPLGLFRAWKLLDINTKYFVYPKASGPEPIDKNALSYSEANMPRSRSGSFMGADFHEHRRFQNGDNHHHIDWKAHARGRPLLIKHFDGDTQRAYLFRLPQKQNKNVEKYLEQLSQWVSQANLEGASFGLIAPLEKTGSIFQGRDHTKMILRRLAAYGTADEF